jgi:hypothetical protein
MLGGGAAARPPPPGPMPGPPAVLLVGDQHAWRDREDSRVLPALRGSLGGQRSTAVSDAGVHLPQVGQVDRAAQAGQAAAVLPGTSSRPFSRASTTTIAR